MTISRPDPSEFAPFYAGYVGKVSPPDPMEMLKNQLTVFERLRAMSNDQGNFQYATGKWTVKEVLGHMADTERVFTYRLVRIARGDQTPLAGFDENAWAAAAPHRHRNIAAVVDEMMAIRRSTLALVDSLDDGQVGNTAMANNKPVSARALCWIIPGHAQHHLDILRDRYQVKI
jgi:uncharacterized damage-inducible protein DinB